MSNTDCALHFNRMHAILHIKTVFSSKVVVRMLHMQILAQSIADCLEARFLWNPGPCLFVS